MSPECPARTVVLLAALTMTALQRLVWNGTAIDLGEVFILKKVTKRAVCKLVSHPFGWELRLYVGSADDIIQTQVCRTEDEVLTTGETWKAKMTEKGWS